MMADLLTSGTADAIVLVKAAPQVGTRYGETVCCAAIDIYGNWVRLYPISFRNLEDGKKFGRWDRISFRWRRPKVDTRVESRRVDQQSLTIVGRLAPSDREVYVSRCVVSSLEAERRKGRSLALLDVRVIDFIIEKKAEKEIVEQEKKFAALYQQADLFQNAPLIPYRPCPYRFKYKYECADGRREGTCQDWEMEATFFRRQRAVGEKDALESMRETFGRAYPAKGMFLAMGTHSVYHDTWLINGVIRLDKVQQGSFLV